MKTLLLTLTTALTASLLAMTSLAGEENQQRKGKQHRGDGEEELRAFCKQQREERQEQMKEQRTENKEFIESLKDKDPSTALTEIIAHRKAQFAENKALAQASHDKAIAFATELMAGNNVPEEKQKERLAEMEEKQSERLEAHAKRHAELITSLEALQDKEDLTAQDIHKVMRDARPEKGEKSQNRERRRNREDRG